MAILGLFLGNSIIGVYLGFYDIYVLCILWVFTIKVPLMEKLGC